MSAPAGGGELSPQLVDSGAQRLAVVGVAVAGLVVAMQVFQRLAQPQLAPIIDDPINRLSTLAAVLTGAGLFALHRYKAAASRTLLELGGIFEIVVAFSISMVETSRPFATNTPVLGLSAIGPWIAILGAVIPTRPTVRLGLALGAATTWPVAYAINSARFGFVTESWPQTSIWPVMNYLLCRSGVSRCAANVRHRAGGGNDARTGQLSFDFAYR